MFRLTLVLSMITTAVAGSVKLNQCQCYERGNTFTPILSDQCSTYMQNNNRMACPHGLIFDVEVCTCVWPHTARCPPSCDTRHIIIQKSSTRSTDTSTPAVTNSSGASKSTYNKHETHIHQTTNMKTSDRESSSAYTKSGSSNSTLLVEMNETTSTNAGYNQSTLANQNTTSGPAEFSSSKSSFSADQPSTKVSTFPSNHISTFSTNTPSREDSTFFSKLSTFSANQSSRKDSATHLDHVSRLSTSSKSSFSADQPSTKVSTFPSERISTFSTNTPSREDSTFFSKLLTFSTNQSSRKDSTIRSDHVSKSSITPSPQKESTTRFSSKGPGTCSDDRLYFKIVPGTGCKRFTTQLEDSPAIASDCPEYRLFDIKQCSCELATKVICAI